MDPFTKFDENFNVFCREISLMNITNQNRDKIFQIVESIVTEGCELSCHFLNEFKDEMIPSEALRSSVSHIISRIRNMNTQYKRDKKCESNPLYVPPQEKAIGVKWTTCVDPKTKAPFYKQIQATFHYVPIKDTLLSLFRIPKFKELYFAECDRKHVCVPGIYKNHCCDAVYQRSDFFKENRYAVQIQIAFDEVNLCSELKSRKKKHKSCHIYFTIRNMPCRYLSKLNNIYLIVLCESENLKQMNTKLDDIMRIIVSEIKHLEKEGILLDDGSMLKGTLVNVASDNLGMNSMIGLVECFNAHFYCRICESPKAVCQKMVKEDISTIRTIARYDMYLSMLPSNDDCDEINDINVEATRGIKHYSSLNKIENFHILQNIFVDVMHDINEGLIPFVLKPLLLYCSTKRILNKNKMHDYIRDFNYGKLNAKNLPSPLDLKSDNLGQNASQLYCIMVNIPFILREHIEKLSEIWICVESALKIMKIVYSPEVDK